MQRPFKRFETKFSLYENKYVKYEFLITSFLLPLSIHRCLNAKIVCHIDKNLIAEILLREIYEITSLLDYYNVILNGMDIRTCLYRKINFARRNLAIKDNVHIYIGSKPLVSLEIVVLHRQMHRRHIFLFSNVIKQVIGTYCYIYIKYIKLLRFIALAYIWCVKFNWDTLKRFIRRHLL